MVAKLLNIVAPEAVYFGQKDAQQVAVIKRLVQDLNLPVRVVVCPTVREPDGLAMSSRNVHLSADERRLAPALFESLQSIDAAVQAGERDPDAALCAGRAVLERHGIEAEYLALVSPETFEPAHELDRELLAVVAARLGPTRLIDNHLIHPPLRTPKAAAVELLGAGGGPDPRRH